MSTYLVSSNMLQTSEDDQDDLPAIMPFQLFIRIASCAIPSTDHMTLQATLGRLVFGRDMLLLISFREDWAQIKVQKQGLIDKDIPHENTWRKPHGYKVGDKVILDKPGILSKSRQPRTGPHAVTEIFQNSAIEKK
jgi:hypothetical protein